MSKGKPAAVKKLSYVGTRPVGKGLMVTDYHLGKLFDDRITQSHGSHNDTRTGSGTVRLRLQIVRWCILLTLTADPEGHVATDSYSAFDSAIRMSHDEVPR